MDPDAKVRPTDRPRPETDRRPAGQLTMRLRHERGGAFVTSGDDADPGTLEGVEQTEERLAGDRERISDAGRAQRVGDEATDGPWARRRDGFELGPGLGCDRDLGRGLRWMGRDRSRELLGRWRGVELGHGDCAPSVGFGPFEGRLSDSSRTGAGPPDRGREGGR